MLHIQIVESLHSLGLATHSSFLLFPILVFLFLSAFFVRVHVLTVKVFQHLIIGVVWAGIYLPGQSKGQSFQMLRSQFTPLWHHHFEFKYQIPFFLGNVQEGHSQTL